jgi:DtxR family Mn-dependent transcriptional regulator
MIEDHGIHEALEAIWSARELEREKIESIQEVSKVILTDDLLNALTEARLAEVHGSNLKLTPLGEEEARQVIRRHRLAERLLHDILNMEVEATEASACEFEHVLADQVTESICTLLGHPRECPHGSPIPEGKCCHEARQVVESLVVPITQLAPGEEGRVAYLSSKSQSRLHKLMAFGISPGMMVKLHQHYPTIVLECEHTQLAMESDIAGDIQVWRSAKKNETPSPGSGSRS